MTSARIRVFFRSQMRNNCKVSKGLEMIQVVKQSMAGVGKVLCAASLAAMIVLMPEAASSQDYASPERTRGAVGYYARARTMLVEALAEFEQGRKLARPDVLIDSEEWRLTLISLTEQLNRVIDPQPRVTQQGVIFRGNPRMIRREKDRTPSVSDGAQASSIRGEQQRLRELEAARAKLYEPKAELAPAPAKETKKNEAAYSGGASPAEGAASVEEAIANAIAQQEEQEVAAPSPVPVVSAPPQARVKQAQVQEADASEEDKQITEAIEEVVKERLRTLESGGEVDAESEEEFEDDML